MNPPLAELSLTQEEATALSTLIDIATKSGGINVAGAATHLYEKLVKACEVFKPKS
jgi:hypothetical protein